MAPASMFKIFRVSTTIIIGINFLFCVATSLGDSAEVRRCHWCGPLAEQIHRSRRAAPCDPETLDTQITDCEPGYNYCAIVATSPPFSESRYCVKLYQDECHSVYCPTTEIWKMTCPCKGDLCNSNKTEREDDAFNSLKKITIITPIQKGRNKKVFKRDTDDLTTTAPSIKYDVAINSPCDQVDNLDASVKSTILTNVDNDVGENAENQNTKDCGVNNDKLNVETAPNSEINNELDDVTKIKDTPANEENINDIKTTTPTPTEIKETHMPIDNNNLNEAVTEITINPSTVEIKPTVDVKVTETQKEQATSEHKPDDGNKVNAETVVPLKAIEIKPTMGMEIENQVSEVQVETENKMETSKPIEEITESTTLQSIGEYKSTIKLQIENQVSENNKGPINEEKPMEVKPSGERPTAEALQDNATPVAMEQSSTKAPMMETTLLTTLKEIVSTAKPSKNSASRNFNIVYLFLVNVHYYYLFL